MLNPAAPAPIRFRLLHALAAATCLLTTASAFGLDGIDLSAPSDPVGEGECPRLIQIKYPFLSCPEGQIGLADGDETWENSRRLPQMGTWTESEGAYGPDRVQD